MNKLSCLPLVLVSVHFDTAQNVVDRRIVRAGVGETSADLSDPLQENWKTWSIQQEFADEAEFNPKIEP